MASLNMVQLIGNLGADPEIRSTQSGSKIANMRIATSESWKNKDTGEKQERTEWHSVVVFGDGLVGVVEQYLHKGSKIYVQGQLRTRKWQDQEGKDRYSTEVVLQNFDAKLVMLDSAGGGGGKAASQEQSYSQASGRSSRQTGNGSYADQRRRETAAPSFESGGMDDDIPF